jgi:hypothetical protein
MHDSELEDLILSQGCHCQVLEVADAIFAAQKQHECLAQVQISQ